MASPKKTPIEFNHTQDSAPEYVEVILWRRVVLALGTLVVALAGIGFLLFNQLTESGESDTLAANSSGDEVVQSDTREAASIVPDQLAPTAAIPEQDAHRDAAAAEQLAQSIPDEPLSDDAAAEKSAATTPAQPALQVAALTTPATAAKKLVQATREAVAQKVEPKTAPKNTATDRHQVRTEIFFPDVKRAMLTTLIHNREPSKAVTSTAGMEQLNPVSLHQFVDIRGRAGDTLTYTWKRNGKIVSKTRVPVGANQWRNYASKAFHQNQHGQWDVEVTDNRNRLLVRTRFYLGA